MKKSIEISVVIPVFDEQENLAPLLEEITNVLAPLDRSFEIICINDASKDNSAAVLNDLLQGYPQLVVATHRKNFGQSAGLATGFRLARGEIIITMDADLQNDPADIPILLADLSNNVDCVCGVRKNRQDSIVKKFSSRVGNKFRDLITGDSVQDAGCAFRIIRRQAVSEMFFFNGMHRFLPTILRSQGHVVTEIPVNHHPRTRGYSKYGIGNRLWRGIFDCFAIRWYIKRSIPNERTKN